MPPVEKQLDKSFTSCSKIDVKCKFGQSEVFFLEYLITSRGLLPNREHGKATYQRFTTSVPNSSITYTVSN